MTQLSENFFQQPALKLAQSLIGKVLRVRYQKTNKFLSAKIIETESYLLEDKASHASLGWTPKRAALFMPAGTIYMYYARGGDSLNISAQGEGNAVLIKAGAVYFDDKSPADMVKIMQRLNPLPGGRIRLLHQLCKGQTLLCKSLSLKVPDWDQKQFCSDFYVDDVNYYPEIIIQTKRLGIPPKRDPDLPYRFVDYHYAAEVTQNPLRKSHTLLNRLKQECI